MDLPIDTLPGSALDAAFAGNRLLATLSESERALLKPHMTAIDLHAGDTVLQAGATVDSSVFPYSGLVVSLIVELSGGRSVEVASIGKEGAVGGIVSAGTAPAFTHGVVQMSGKAATVPMHVLEVAKQASPHLHNLFGRYADFLLAQVMQSVACNAFHPIEARAARWMLHAQDRVGGDRLELTQEGLAGLLGVQRTTVNAVARELQESGLIAYRRGAIQVCDRPALMRAACECYAAVEDHFAAVLGPDGLGRLD
ncbi:MAG: cAMP-binding proteins - catabolite gene activator and regulatory subunit of cAMP-dependent protein kinases [uncultured Sphingomonas sp.]|uniref:cAMP-binding proteins - catabolite gene activator and regulatory subunit of cAMP-dependent protein kinases n=1 Tax=uncultured Sphingomonas sp. TaxID=158754 RepID=A0A6J4T5E2_9SPHN|nr:MAG: cAMP-binding proteins - catabolite gene activator and regulatory subunit of cAMP-dependent protein kinases [uncultured Sphingomonas sp.]